MQLGNREGLDGTTSWHRERRPLDSQARLKGQDAPSPGKGGTTVSKKSVQLSGSP